MPAWQSLSSCHSFPPPAAFARAQWSSLLSSSARQRLARALIFVAPALFAANYVVGRAAVGVVEPHLLACLRWSFALALMLLFALPELARQWPAWRHEWRDMLLLGALGMWICGAFVYIGAHTTQAINIGLLYAIAPVLIAAAAAIWFSDSLRSWQWAGLVLALAGMLVIVARGSLANLLAVRFTTGDLWILTAVLSWVVYSLVLRQRPSVLGPFARLTAITAGGVLVLLPFTIAELAVAGAPRDWTQALLLSLVVALLPGFGAYQAYSFMQRELGTAQAGMVLYLSPLYTALIAWWYLAEAPQWFHLAGAALILPGMYLANRRPAS